MPREEDEARGRRARAGILALIADGSDLSRLRHPLGE